MAMIGANESFVLSPSDITRASACEFSWLREIDIKLGRTPSIDTIEDAMLARTAVLGQQHEERYLAALKADGRQIVELTRPDPYTAESLAAARDVTIEHLQNGADVVYQGALFDGAFGGLADFIIRADDGRYTIGDTKLSKHAKIEALLQIAAYADLLDQAGIPRSRMGFLLLGDNSKLEQDLDEIIHVYRERRTALSRRLTEHLAQSDRVAWNNPLCAYCGGCDHCAAEIETSGDVWRVARLTKSQRLKLHDAGIWTVGDLAASTGFVEGIPDRTLAPLRAQASLQTKQGPPGADGRIHVLHEVFDPAPIANLPLPNPGDIFFDFEGDPLWIDRPENPWGLEYLFGVVEPDETDRGKFVTWWAHDRAGEKQALTDFLDYVDHRRRKYPDMHIYHYAAYEVSALKRLVARHQRGEAFLDDLLRDGVFVDLYAVVRQAIRVSQPSYSLKFLEPLYMGELLRDDDAVKTATESLVQYQEFLEAQERGDAVDAEQILKNIADYNQYDCVSTWRLRDWLLSLDIEGVEIESPESAEPVDVPAPTVDEDSLELVEDLLEQVPIQGERSADQQAYALLAAALGFHEREAKPFWWMYFDRLTNPEDEWVETRGTLIADRVELLDQWGKLGKERKPRRTIRLHGRLEPGASIEEGVSVRTIYEPPVDGMDLPAHATRTAGASQEVLAVDVIDGFDAVTIREKALKSGGTFDALPMGLFEFTFYNNGVIEGAIRELAERVRDEGELLPQPALDILARRPPRMLAGTFDGDVSVDEYEQAITQTLANLDHSYVGVQGPPGTGKTHVGSRVVKNLVDDGWRIGIVAQSHATVEHFLKQVLDAGVDPERVGKMPKQDGPQEFRWTNLEPKGVAGFLSGSGVVLGGTAWTFTNEKYVARNQLDLLVIDEAGQFSLANTIAVSVAAQRLLLLGDPQQLPQVSQGTHPEPVDTSALGWLTDGHETMPPSIGFFLERTRRMHSALTRTVSRLSYDDRLRALEEITDVRHLTGIQAGLHPIAVEHSGNDVSSPEEAATVVRIARSVLNETWKESATDSPRAMRPSDVLVVAPYNAQVALISDALDATGFTDTRVGTVDKFQGQEAPVVIVSMTSSSPEDVPRGMEFLLNRNRLNVAISRGQWASFLVHSPNLSTANSSSATGLAELGAFLRLVRASA